MKTDHHEIPQMASGETTVSLDPGCHTNLHMVAYMMMNPNRSGAVRDTLMALYPDPEARQRCVELINLVYQELLNQREGTGVGRKVERVTIELTPAEKRALKVLAQESGLGMGRFVGGLVRGAIRKQFPWVYSKPR